MRRAGWIMLLLSIVAMEAHAQPFADMVRDLNSMQSRMAFGDAAAREQAARQFDLIERSISEADAPLLSDERNARAAIIYLLCGGAPGKVRDLVRSSRVNETLSALLEASLQYADGDAAATNALMHFDARQYPPALGGHLALVQAGLLIGTDNARAIALLDLARLLMPGSLVEEAALRREISILDPVRDAEKLGLLAVRYASKYASSPFARHFWALLPAIARGVPTSSLLASRFAVVLDKAPTGERADLYLALSRRALLAGKFEEAEKAIEMATKDIPGASVERRIKTYRTVLSALEDRRSFSALRALETAGLPPEDIELVELAASVGAKLEAPSDNRNQTGDDAVEEEKSEMAENARRALAQADELLKRAGRQ